MEDFIGRRKQISILEKCKEDSKSHFIAVYGRRRVGKTYLIRHFFDNQFTFYATGLANADLNTHLITMHAQLLEYEGTDNNLPVPKSWMAVFTRLIRLLESSTDRKKIIFLDELPWMDTKRSGFLTALEYFWNSWASARNDILLIVCGSAASWMINKLLNAKGGLHNRLTRSIRLEPFNLYEVELFLKNRNYHIDRYQIVQLYMVFGGIPYYLEMIDTQLSITQNIEALCFADKRGMHSEYDILFRSLFDNPERHMSIVEVLANSKAGLSRNDIIKKTGLPKAGSTTQLLQELELSNFIRSYRQYGKKSRETTYQLIDNYTLFYHRFLKLKTISSNYWITTINTPTYYNWAGYAFEIVALQHVEQLKNKLGITGVQTSISSFQNQHTQIDLIIDRQDRVINLVEIKFSIDAFEINKTYDEILRTKISEFIAHTNTKKAVWLTLVSTYGLKNNKYAGQVQSTIELDDLFEKT